MNRVDHMRLIQAGAILAEPLNDLQRLRDRYTVGGIWESFRSSPFGPAPYFDCPLSNYVNFGPVKSPGAESFVFWHSSLQIMNGWLGLNGPEEYDGICHLGGLGFLRDGMSNYRVWDIPASAEDGNWHCWIVTAPGGAANDINDAQAYLDGEILDIESTSDGGTPAYGDFTLGRTLLGTASISCFRNLAIFDRVLTPTEVADIAAMRGLG